ncbi:MAG: Amidophosphoribosyltransferase [Firmicutes bacterium]|nr:Amidophosphoribosyltransferase [Bacillota bacterium]
MPYVAVDGKLREECGVLGLYGRGLDVARLGYFGLFALQHRGQESAGLAVTNGKEIKAHKGLGLVAEVFTEGDIASLSAIDAHIAVGHVRYSTAGGGGLANSQPLVASHLRGHVALAHNGNLVNSDKLREELEGQGAIFHTTSDTEVILSLMARYRQSGNENALVQTLTHVQGAYSLALGTDTELIGVRDPYGFRPLCLGQIGNEGYVLASESAAIDALGGEFLRDIQPGEIVVIDERGARFRRFAESPVSACVFEYIYFARNDSTIDGLNVYRARQELGRQLAKEHPVAADIVISVPDSGTPAALGYAAAANLPYAEGLVKNRYVGRTFIEPGQALRELKVRLKLTANTEVIAGKRVVMVDDSIVRGTTTQILVKLLRQAGASEVHVRVSCPPYVSPCYFGIDTPSSAELVAARCGVQEMCALLGADSLGFLSLVGTLAALSPAQAPACVSCFTGVYPMSIAKLKTEADLNRKADDWGDVRG